MGSVNSVKTAFIGRKTNVNRLNTLKSHHAGLWLSCNLLPAPVAIMGQFSDSKYNGNE